MKGEREEGLAWTTLEQHIASHHITVLLRDGTPTPAPAPAPAPRPPVRPSSAKTWLQGPSSVRGRPGVLMGTQFSSPRNGPRGERWVGSLRTPPPPFLPLRALVGCGLSGGTTVYGVC